jgi:hypothetical protein
VIYSIPIQGITIIDQNTQTMDMMEKVMKLDQNTQTMVVLLLWLWWDERNKRREEGRQRKGVEVAYVAAAMADKLKNSKAPKPLSDHLLSDDRQAQVWRRPIPDSLKLNSDGAFLE